LSQLSPLARDFVSIGFGKYLESKDFISDNPSILAQKEIDALVAEAFAALKAGQSIRSQTCVHQALLLRECKKVGLDNIGPLFRDLTARGGKTKESFGKDVRKVCLSIQELAARASLQNREPTTGSQGRRFSLISLPAEGRVSQNPSTYTQGPEEPTQGQTPGVRGPGGQMYCIDPEGNLLRPASSRHHEPNRYGSRSDPVESYSKRTGIGAEEGRKSAAKAEAGSGDDKHTPSQASIPHRTAASDHAEPLPTLPENRRLETTMIRGVGGSTEKLDHREYLPVTSQKSSYR
jgi:hypothetical protein